MWFLLFAVAFIFIITYDPKSRTLEKYIPVGPAPCKDGHYNEVQFGQSGYDCPQNKTNYLGAVIST
jgi:hypothetical protein